MAHAERGAWLARRPRRACARQMRASICRRSTRLLTWRACRRHSDSLKLMTFAAKLSFSVVEGEIEEKLTGFWDQFVRVFFSCPELDANGDSMEVDGGAAGLGLKPLLIVAPDPSEDQVREAAHPAVVNWIFGFRARGRRRPPVPPAAAGSRARRRGPP